MQGKTKLVLVLIMGILLILKSSFSTAQVPGEDSADMTVRSHSVDGESAATAAHPPSAQLFSNIDLHLAT